jgi:hypothetical protein
MDIGYVRSKDGLKIDPCKKDKHLPLDKVYLGVLATDTMAAIKQELGDKDPSSCLFPVSKVLDRGSKANPIKV